MLKIFALLVTLCYSVLSDPVLSSAGPPSQVIRPCRLNDYRCIQDNIAANSDCSRNIVGFIPDVCEIPEFEFHTPHFNASYVDRNLVYRNHNKCFVSEYFVNVKTDKSVLSIDCPNLAMSSNRTLYQHTSKLEDTAYSYSFKGVYPLVRFTVNLNHADKIDLCNAFTYSDVTALPIFDINPNDISTANFLSRDLSALYIYEREAFFYRGPHFMKTFINSLICDFKCN